MAQQTKITKTFDLRNTARVLGQKVNLVTVNTSITNTYAGQYIVVSNSDPVNIALFLPTTATGAGDVYTIFNANTKPMLIRATGAHIMSIYGLVTEVNFGITGAIRGCGCEIFGDGTYWYLKPFGATNGVVNSYLGA